MGIIPPWLQARGFKFRKLEPAEPLQSLITNESALNYYSELQSVAKEDKIPVIKTKSLNQWA